MSDNYPSRDRLTKDQCEALRLAPGDAVAVMLDGSEAVEGVLIARPNGPGSLWEVAIRNGVVALNPHAPSFQAIVRKDNCTRPSDTE